MFKLLFAASITALGIACVSVEAKPPTIACPDGTVVRKGKPCPKPPQPTPEPPPAIVSGSRVIAVKACQSLTNPVDFLIINSTYVVVGSGSRVPEADLGLVQLPPTFYVLQPYPADGVHVGDGYMAYWVHVDCVKSAL